jgi:hypothetical protein
MAVTGPWVRDLPFPFRKVRRPSYRVVFCIQFQLFGCGPGAAVRTIIGYLSERLKRDRGRQARTNRGHRKIAAKVRLLRSRSQ